MAFPTSWGRRCAVTIDNTKVSGSGNHSNFPVLIDEDSLPSEMFDADGSYPALNGGGDVRFTSDSAGSSLLYLEVVSFVTDNDPANGTAQLWVKVPTLDYNDDTVIYVWYNKAGESQPAVGATGGRNGVWTDYLRVYHFEEGSGNAVDSSGNADRTPSNVSYSATGKIGNAFDFNGSTSKVCESEMTAMREDSAHTISMWADADSWRTTAGARNIPYINIRTAGQRCALVRKNATTTIQYDTFDLSTTRSSGATLTDLSSSHYIVGTCSSGAVPTLYLDGSVGGATSYLGGGGGDANCIGSDNVDTNGWDGQLDEVRMKAGESSADWVATEYANQNAPNTFSSAGTPETPGGGTTTYNALAMSNF